MRQSSAPAQFAEIIYPTSDGKPMAENTLQFEWIVLIKENCERLFADRSDVFVAGDLLWYPVEGRNKLCLKSLSFIRLIVWRNIIITIPIAMT